MDSRETQSGTIVDDNYNKIKKVGGFTFVVAGTVADIEALCEGYVLGGLTEFNKLEATAFVIDDGEVFQITVSHGRYYTDPVTTNATLGSGEHLALAAMDHGDSARDAVKYAKTRDIYTGGRVRVVKVK